jgi:hypothetical protein
MDFIIPQFHIYIKPPPLPEVNMLEGRQHVAVVVNTYTQIGRTPQQTDFGVFYSEQDRSIYYIYCLTVRMFAFSPQCFEHSECINKTPLYCVALPSLKPQPFISETGVDTTLSTHNTA